MTHCKWHGEYIGETTPCCIHAAMKDQGIMTSPMVIMRKIKEEEVEFTLECLEEDAPVRGNAIASGDEEYDTKVEDKIINDLNSGDLWAWCTVKVTVKWKGFKGVDYLGCCSYKDEEDFKAGGYYEDMRAAALDDLNESINKIYNELEELQVAVVD